MKKILMFIVIMIFVSLSTFATGDDYAIDIVEVSVLVNGEYLYSDTPHMLMRDKVFIVGKYLVEAFGGEIEWFGETKTVIMTLDEKTIEVQIGNKVALVNGEIVELYKAPYIKDGRTMLPLKFVAEQFGCDVTWQQDIYTVLLEKADFVLPEPYQLKRLYTDEDLNLLAKIVTVESGDASLEMAMAIANTVLNRVKDERFPNTIEGVIYQIDRYVQFPPAHKSSFEALEPSIMAIVASKKSLEGVNPIGNSLYFNNQPFKSKANDLIRIIEGEYFYE